MPIGSVSFGDVSAPESHPGDPGADIHLPPPSLAPAVIGLGVMLFGFGALYGLALMAAGGIVVLLGLGTWLVDDARAFGRAGDSSGGH